MQLLVARLGKPHGLRGEATSQVHSDSPEERFVPGTRFVTEPASAGPLTLRSARLHQGVWLLGFEEAADRSAIEALRNTQLFIDVDLDADTDGDAHGGTEEGSDAADEGEDGWYEDELLGLSVVTTDGRAVGEVSALITRPVQDLLEVRLAGGGVALVPFVAEIVPEIDPEAGVVTIDPPEGLLELAQGEGA